MADMGTDTSTGTKGRLASSAPSDRFLAHTGGNGRHVHPAQPGLAPSQVRNSTYRLRIRDRIWNMVYQPLADASFWMARKVGKLQHGRIQIYILYSFVTIIALLLLL